MSAMQDPKIMQLVGQNPMAQQIQAAMMAHINEHIAFEYRKQMEAEMGIELPYHPDDDADEKTMPQELEVRVSQLAAQASQALLQRDINEVRAQQAAAAAQDPILQMQQQELAIKQAEVDIKNRKLVADAAAKVDQLDIERERIASQERIAGAQIGAKVEQDKANLIAKQQLEGTKLGVDIAKSKDQMARTRATEGRK
jgi:hypothetical protein